MSTTHPPRTTRTTQALHVEQDNLFDSDKSLCPRCGALVAISKKHPICKPCYGVLEAIALEQEERRYLAAWLRSRVDECGNPLADSALTFTPSERQTVLRLAAKARRIGVDWTIVEPTLSFATRLRMLLAPYGGGDDSGEAA